MTAFRNEPLDRDAIYWEHEGNAAVRAGDLKLVRFSRNGPWELYDLKVDRTEQHNLVGERPEQVRELSAKWQAWAERAQVLPYPAIQGGRKKTPNKAASK